MEKVNRKSPITILYSLSIATQGLSGIPKDSRRLGKILAKSERLNVDFLLIPRHSNQFKVWQRRSVFTDALTVSSITSNAQFPSRLNLFATGLKALISPRRRPLVESSFSHSLDFQNHFWPEIGLKLKTGNKYFLIPNLDLKSIYLRAKIRKPFIFRSEHDVYIQQHVDPLYAVKKSKHIIRLHDILPITHPQFFSPGSIATYSIGIRALLKNSSITWVLDSIHQKNQFAEIFGAEHKIEVIGCAIPDEEFEVNKIKKKRQFLVVNTLEPRKQTQKVIESFLEARNMGFIPKDFKLVVVGNRGWMQDGLFEKLSKNEFGPTVIHQPYVTNHELKNLYKSSKFLISASLAEGFGLPPIEGALNGCIPIVSDIPSHRENLGEFAIYFDPLASTFTSIFCDLLRHEPKYRATLPALRKKLNEKFSERVIANEWEELIETVVQS